MADNGQHPCVWELSPFLMHFFHPSGLFTRSIFLLTRAHSATHRSIHYRGVLARGSPFRSMEIARRGERRRPTTVSTTVSCNFCRDK